MPHIIFDRQGMIVYAIPGPPDRPPRLMFKIVRPSGEVQLAPDYVRELEAAVVKWEEEQV